MKNNLTGSARACMLLVSLLPVSLPTTAQETGAVPAPAIATATAALNDATNAPWIANNWMWLLACILLLAIIIKIINHDQHAAAEKAKDPVMLLPDTSDHTS